MASSSGGGSSDDKKKLVMVGGRFVSVDGKLILGPCDRTSSWDPPVTQGFVATYEGDYYLLNVAVAKNVSLAGSGSSRNNEVYGSGQSYSEVVEVGTITDFSGGLVYVKFRRASGALLAQPAMFVVSACSWKTTWPSYDVAKREITGFYDLDDLRNTALMDEVFGPSVWNDGGWYTEGDCRRAVRLYAHLLGYDGPSAGFEVRNYKPGKLTWDANNKITNFL
jgi:hypothetical protein